MTCPKCSIPVKESTGQSIALTAVAGSGLGIAAPGIFGMMLVPYLAPVLVAGLVWSALCKVTCPSCGHRFTYFQEGQ